MRYTLRLSFFLMVISQPFLSFTQDLNLIGRANFGIGFDYTSQDFNGIKTFFSPGGGLGLEAGIEGEFKNDIYWYSTLGFTFNLNFHYEEVNGKTSKTSFSWNKKFITVGANKYHEINNKFISDIYGGGGLLLGVPGTMRRTVNNDYKGRVNYHIAPGIQLHGGATLTISDNFLLRPEIRYRFIQYNSKSFSKGDIKDLQPEVRKARADGLDLSLSIIKQIRTGRR
ncbi:MAG: hypothetical protein ACJA08_003036 [Cyclobacteriaceae bacterium]|jgi:hypothetical protein